MTTIYIIKRLVSDYEYSYEENLYAVTDEETARKEVAKLQDEFNELDEMIKQVNDGMSNLVDALEKDTERFGEYQNIYGILDRMPNVKSKKDLIAEQNLLQKCQTHNHNRMIAIHKAAFEIVSKELNLTARQLEKIQFDHYMNPYISSDDVVFEYDCIELFAN